MEIITTHNDHCYVMNCSNFYSAVCFLNDLTTVTEAHSGLWLAEHYC